MTRTALKLLAKNDPSLGALITRVGRCKLAPEPERQPFESLVRAVAHQQLHARAAARILERFLALFTGSRFPTARALGSVSDEQLRAAGFSASKTAALRDIASKSLEGIIPRRAQLAKLQDEAIIERLVTVRGVGRWTAEMLLIFQLGRPDVLPVDDFGVRNGFRIAFGLPAMPKPAEVRARGELWRPHRTTAAWYLWRAADAASVPQEI